MFSCVLGMLGRSSFFGLRASFLDPVVCVYLLCVCVIGGCCDQLRVVEERRQMKLVSD